MGNAVELRQTAKYKYQIDRGNYMEVFIVGEAFCFILCNSLITLFQYFIYVSKNLRSILSFSLVQHEETLSKITGLKSQNYLCSSGNHHKFPNAISISRFKTQG